MRAASPKPSAKLNWTPGWKGIPSSVNVIEYELWVASGYRFSSTEVPSGPNSSIPKPTVCGSATLVHEPVPWMVTVGTIVYVCPPAILGPATVNTSQKIEDALASSEPPGRNR